MLRIFLTTASSVIFLLFIGGAVCFGFGGAALGTAAPEEATVTGDMKELTIKVRKSETGEIVQVPLFSEEQADLPVAAVDGEPITLEDFARELAAMHSSGKAGDQPGRKDYRKLLDRLIAIELVQKEANNIGLDRIPDLQKKMEAFALKALIQELLARQITDLEVDEAKVDELYEKMALEAKTRTYKFYKRADADAVYEKVQQGGDFEKLADEMVAAGKAEVEEEEEYLKLNELYPDVARAAYEMEPGSVSEVFTADGGFLLFKLEDRRVYQDPEVRLAARQRLLDRKSKKVQKDYIDELIEKYATFHDEVLAGFDFAKIAEENPQAQAGEVLAELSRDMRSVVTVSSPDETIEITVAEVAEEIKSGLYHGTDRNLEPRQLDNQKLITIKNELTKIVGRMEAEQQGIETTSSYLKKIEQKKRELLFEAFMAKAVVPGIKVKEEEARDYYAAHPEDYSTPLMLQMKSLVFDSREAARDAFEKLQAGSDYKWVSANATGLADPDNEDILGLSGPLLSVTSLPEDLQKQVKDAQTGDRFLYAGPDDLHYVLSVTKAFPPETEDYQKVRQEIGKIVYARKINEAYRQWVDKLKEAYETEIYIVEDSL